MIDNGSPPLGIATFNGGLFDAARHPFLEKYTVGDHHLRLAIDQLARVDGEVIDYRDLAERHLGTIYEGLLEFQIVPLAAPVDGWSIDLLTSDGQRKASGSYYTPGFVTRYMVEGTIGPMIDRALKDAAGGGTEAQVKAVFDLNVLDCAMGSGHFLVEATEYIARRMVEAGLPVDMFSLGAGQADDLAYWKRRVAQGCDWFVW